MKKAVAKETKKETKKGTANAPARAALKWLAADEVIDNVRYGEKGDMHMDLVAPIGENHVCTLDVYPTNFSFDNAILDVFGFSIRVTVRSGKNGMFISFPQEKGKDGAYYDRVTCFDSGFHKLVKELLEKLYADENGTD